MIRMPLFFFINGYFVYSNNYDWKLLAKRSKNRLLRQLYPTIIFWAFYCLLYENVQFDSLLDSGKRGYWFTLVVVEMFFLLHLSLLLRMSGT